MHAVADFIFQHKEKANVWHNVSNSIIILSVPSEQDLYAVSNALRGLKLSFTKFIEPDLGDQLTAIAIEPCIEATLFCKKFRTALRPGSIVTSIAKESANKEKLLKNKYKVEAQ